jgi:hypothetical protein
MGKELVLPPGMTSAPSDVQLQVPPPPPGAKSGLPTSQDILASNDFTNGIDINSPIAGEHDNPVQPQAVVQPSLGATSGSLTDGIDTNAAIPGENGVPLKEVAPEAPHEPVKDATKLFSLYAEYLGKGQKEFAKEIAGRRARNGEITLEEAQRDFSPQRMEEYDKQKINPLESVVPFPEVHKAIKPFIEMIPQLVGDLGEMGKGAAVAGGIGAAAGTVVEPGGGTAALGLAGLPIGATAAAADLASGSLYLDMVNRGVPPKVAKDWSGPGGLLIGLLQMTGVGRLGSKAAGMVAEKLASNEGQKFLIGTVTKYATEIGLQGGLGAAQSLANSTTKAIAGAVSHVNGVVTPEEAKEAAIQAGLGQALTGGATLGLSDLVGSILKRALSNKTEAHAKFQENGIPEDIKLAQLEHEAKEAAKTKEATVREKPKPVNQDYVKDVLQADKPVEEGANELANAKNRPTLYGVIRNGTGSFLFNWKGLWQLATKDSKAGDAFFDEVMDVGKYLTKIHAEVRRWDTKKFELLAEATGRTKADVQELQRLGRKKNQILIPFKNNKGGIDMTGITAMQGVRMLGEARDPQLLRGFVEGNGFMPDLVTQLTQALNSIDKAYVQMVKGYDKFYKEYYPGLDKEYAADNGKPLGEVEGKPNNPFYAGHVQRINESLKVEDDFKSSLDMQAKDRTNRKTAKEPDFTKARTNPDMAIAPQDAEHAAFKYLRLGEQYKHLWEWAKYNLKPTLANPEVRNIIKRKGGAALLHAIDHTANYILRGSVKEDIAWARFLDKVFGGIRFGALANNWLFLPEHFLSQITGVQYVPLVDYMKGLAEYYDDPVGAQRTIEGLSEQYHNRYADVEKTMGGQNLSPSAQHPKVPKSVVKALGAYYRFSMGAIELGSKTQVLPLMYSVYKYWKGKGLSDKDAIYKAETAMESTSTSNRADMTSVLSHYPGGRWAVMFQQQVTHFAQMSIIDLDKFFAHSSKETAAKAVRTSLVSALAIGIFPIVRSAYKASMSNDPDKVDEEKFKAMQELTVGLVPGLALPVISDIVKAESTIYHNKVSGDNFTVYDPSSPIQGTIKASENLTADILDSWTNKEWDSDARSKIGVHFFSGPGKGLGLEKPFNFYKAVNDKLESVTGRKPLP